MAHTFHSYPASATIGGMMDRESISFRIQECGCVVQTSDTAAHLFYVPIY